jgi:cytochrome c biogenesis protein CcmG, thiol:disulfide interchange protein DsbE
MAGGESLSPMQSRRPPILLILFVLLAMVVLYQHRHGVVARVRALTNVKPVGRSVLEAGQPLPAVQMTNLAGEHLALAARPGHILYLNVFATWCPDCQEETPALEQLSRATASMPVDVVGVDQEEEVEPVSAFAQRYGLTYPIFLDQDGVTHDLMGVRFIPTSLIVDSHGIVRARITGALTLAQMESAVGTVLRGGTIASN